MEEQADLEVALVRKTDWHTLASPIIGGSAPVPRLAGAILTSLHNRHVGITPALALDLARSLLAGPSQLPPEPWRSVENRLRQTLLDLTSVSRDEAARLPAEAMPLRLGTSFGYAVFRLANNLVHTACRNVGHSILFCEDDDVPGVSVEEYNDYAQAVSKEVLALTRPGSNVMPDVFWQEGALVLGGLARTRDQLRNESENRALPAVNSPDLGLFLRLNPDLRDRDELPSRDLLPYQLPDLMTRYHFDAGTDGIHMTRNLDELHRRLVSESLYPEIIQLDHLVNTGFLATRRPPQPIRVRDVLIVGLLPGELNETAAGLLARTCWFEFLLRLGPLLQRSGLERSELRWIEGNASGRYLTQSLLVRDLPDIALESADPKNQKLRQRLRLASGWLPAYLDRHAFFLSADGDQDVHVEHLADPLERWFYHVWRAQKDNQRWQQSEEDDYRLSDPLQATKGLVFVDEDLDTSKYAYVHLNLFLPAARIDKGQSEYCRSTGYWRRLFQLYSQRSSLSLTAVPARVEEIYDPEQKRHWQFLSSWYHDERLLTQQTSSWLRELAAKLVSQWMRTIIKDLSYG